MNYSFEKKEKKFQTIVKNTGLLTNNEGTK